MRARAQHYAILVVDIESFGSRPDPVQEWLRGRLYEVLEEALDDTGIDHRAEPRPTDRGDGAFWLLPGSVSKVDLSGRFVDLLQAGLRAHARTSNTEGAMRLRVALHFGEVAWDGRGWVGADLNTACRIVDLDVLRATLKAAPRSGLALAASDAWYQAVLRHDHPQAESAPYRAVPFDAKEVHGATVWVRVPGYDRPPGLHGVLGATPGGPGQEQARRPEAPVGIEVPDRSSLGQPPAPAPPAVDPGGSYDVFISYAEADSGSAEALDSRLRAEGLHVFLAKWIGPGLVESLEKEQALCVSTNGILVFSGATMSDPAIRDEYAALLQRVHSGGRRFIPVLVEDVDLPPFARIRRPVDLRDPSSTQFEESLATLVRAVRPWGDAA